MYGQPGLNGTGHDPALIVVGLEEVVIWGEQMTGPLGLCS